MQFQHRYQAVILDMDGVITQTAILHRQAWKRLFDDYLNKHHPKERPFTDEDYRRYVDGKPRYDGVRDFLASRTIQLAEGSPSDGPSKLTHYGLGQRKNGMFLELLQTEGVQVYEDTLTALERWREEGLRLAAISSSRNCQRVLGKAGLLPRFDAIVDGQVAASLHLSGKPGLIAEAGRLLQVAPDEAVVLEDAIAGVRAARQAGVGFVVGVDRGSYEDALYQAGADQVVQDVASLRLPGRVPPLYENLEPLKERLQEKPPVVFLDYDGTLTPIVDNPNDAHLPPSMRSVLEALASQTTVAIVSGRDRKDVANRVGLSNLFYAGSHGLDIAGPDRTMSLEEADEATPHLQQAEETLRQQLGEIEGVIFEGKRFSLAVHYRLVAPEEVEGVKETITRVAGQHKKLRLRTGKKVLELQPDLDWNKGNALRWLLDALEIDRQRSLVLYLGDDDTDEDAFAALGSWGVALCVGPPDKISLAHYRLQHPEEVEEFLRWLSTQLAP